MKTPQGLQRVVLLAVQRHALGGHVFPEHPRYRAVSGVPDQATRLSKTLTFANMITYTLFYFIRKPFLKNADPKFRSLQVRAPRV